MSFCCYQTLLPFSTSFWFSLFIARQNRVKNILGNTQYHVYAWYTWAILFHSLNPFFFSSLASQELAHVVVKTESKCICVHVHLDWCCQRVLDHSLTCSTPFAPVRTVELLCTLLYKSDKQKVVCVCARDILVAYHGNLFRCPFGWTAIELKPNKLFLPTPNPLAATWLYFKCSLKFAILHYFF